MMSGGKWGHWSWIYFMDFPSDELQVACTRWSTLGALSIILHLEATPWYKAELGLLGQAGVDTLRTCSPDPNQRADVELLLLCHSMTKPEHLTLHLQHLLWWDEAKTWPVKYDTQTVVLVSWGGICKSAGNLICCKSVKRLGRGSFLPLPDLLFIILCLLCYPHCCPNNKINYVLFSLTKKITFLFSNKGLWNKLLTDN